jgi:polysaccharide biosynthesis/export protein
MLLKKNILCFFVISILSFSCADTKKVVYFNNIGDSQIASTIESQEPVVQKNDLLNISISSLNPEASSIFNAPNREATSGSTATGGSLVQATGYLVDQDGNIQLPMLGNVKAAGLSKSVLKENIAKSLIDKKLLLDPIVNVRYLNYKVTVLGEVSRPSVVNVPSEKITLLEAIGLAGDLTIYARRENVMVIREEQGKKIIKRLNLNSSELFTSPYYYLKSNDIVYIEPNRERVSSANTTSSRNISLLLSALSFAATVFYLVRTN